MAAVVPTHVVTLIDAAFPWAKNQKAGELTRIYYDDVGTLHAISGMIGAMPSELAPLAPKEAALFNAALYTIRAQLAFWQAHGKNSTLGNVRGLDRRSPVAVLRELLASCPDEPTEIASQDFLFISDLDLRASLQADLAAVASALSNAEWKAATVLSGSLVEALLLWGVSKRSAQNSSAVPEAIDRALKSRKITKKPQGDIEEWALHPLIEVANELGILKPDTVEAARLAKNFRNLIHPGVAARKEAICDVGTASAARAALHFVTRDLARL